MSFNVDPGSPDVLPKWADETPSAGTPRRGLKRKLTKALLLLCIGAVSFHLFLMSNSGDIPHWVPCWPKHPHPHHHGGRPAFDGESWRNDDPWGNDEPSQSADQYLAGQPSTEDPHRGFHGDHHGPGHRGHGMHRNGYRGRGRHGKHHEHHGGRNHSAVHQLSEKVLNSVSLKQLREYADHAFNAGPHLSAQNEALANWTRDQFEAHGLETRTDTYDIWVNYPISHRVALLDPESGEPSFELSLEEPPLKEDPATRKPDRIPTFHGYSASGNVTGRLVYANLGRKQDYDRLTDEGIDLKDKVVIVRYGGIFRGLKVKFAEQLGAAAVLIYSDPAEDGEITEANGYEAYPHGPARNRDAVQRGSVQDLSYAPGDPTTPGFPSTPDNEPNRTNPGGIPGIPSVPISYADAIPLLKKLNHKGPKYDDWKGALDGITYSVGPSHDKVLVENFQDYDFRPNRDVIGTFKGKSDDVVVVGNHRDAWVLGGADPNSGTAVLLELSRVLGELVAGGWKPKRTIVLASWDGEEYGLLGSTEWGEDHADELRKKAIAYLNVDVAVSGPKFHVSANPLLREAIEYAAHKTPFGNVSLSEHWGGEADTRIGALGSGSDYTVFQDFLGIPSLDAGFGGDNSSPVYHYHSNYDSWKWMTEFGDPDFHRHGATTKFLALALIDIVESDQTPFSVVNYAKAIKRELKALLKNYEGPAVEEVGALFGEVYHFLHASKRFTAKAKQLERDINNFDLHWWNIAYYALLKWTQRGYNEKLKLLDRSFVYEEGLEDRPWFKHLVYAPGRYTGYAGQVFPGIAESLEDNDDKRLVKWVDITTEALRNAASTLS